MSARRWRHQWKASEMPHLESHTGTTEEFASKIFFKNRGRHDPNCMAFGLVNVLVDALTSGVTLSGAAEELHIRRGFLFALSTDARRGMQMKSPTTYSYKYIGRMMIEPAAPVPTVPVRRKK